MRIIILRHSVDSQQERERPNLLLNSKRNSIPTINILSSLENRQHLQHVDKFGHKKIWALISLISLAIAITCVFSSGNLQNSTQNTRSNFASFLDRLNSTDAGKATTSNTNHLPVAKDQGEPPALSPSPSPSIIDGGTTALESAAVLIEVTIEREKAGAMNAVLSNSKTQVKAVATSPKVTMQKHALREENNANRKDKELQKTHAVAEKNELKAFDSDVALLSALVANTSKSKEQLSGNIGNSLVGKVSVAPPINLDIVERNPGDNTKNLLSRCEKLGGAEAKLCHDRICAGTRQTEAFCAQSKD